MRLNVTWSEGHWEEPEYEGMAGCMRWYGEINNITLLRLDQYSLGDKIFGWSRITDEDHYLFIPEKAILQEAQAIAEQFLAEWFDELGMVPKTPVITNAVKLHVPDPRAQQAADWLLSNNRCHSVKWNHVEGTWVVEWTRPEELQPPAEGFVTPAPYFYANEPFIEMCLRGGWPDGDDAC